MSKRNGLPKAKSGRRRFLPWLLGCLALVAAIVYFAPTLVANTSLLAMLLRSVEAELGAKISVESASLAWFQPIRARGIVVQQGAEEPTLRLPEASLSQTLWQLLWSPDALGTVLIQAPELHVDLRPDGSNIEELLAKILAKPRKTEWTGSCDLRITDGVIHLRDTQTGHSRTFRDCDFSLVATEGTKKPLRMDVSLKDLENAPQTTISSKVVYQDLLSGVPPQKNADVTIDWNCAEFPLEVLSPMTRRFAGGTEIGGILNGGGHSYVSSSASTRNPFSCDFRGTASIAKLDLRSPTLGEDRIQLERVDVGLNQAGITQGMASIRDLAVVTDVGQLQLSIAPTDRQEWIQSGINELSAFAQLLRSRIDTNGRIDLAALAAQLPYTLRLKQDTAITSGEITWDWKANPEGDKTVWTGEIRTANLQARQAGQTLAWQQPFSARFSASSGSDGFVVDSLHAESSFFQLSGGGTLEQFTANGRCDLAKLLDEAGRFADLGDIRLTGLGDLELNWRRVESDQLEAKSRFTIQDFAFGTAGNLAWQEPRLVGDAEALLRLVGVSLGGVEKAAFRFQGQRESLGMALVEPMSAPITLAHGKWQVQATGDLSRAGSLGLLGDGWNLQGRYDATLDLATSSDQWAISNGRFVLSQPRLTGPGIDANEPRADLALAANWRPREQAMSIQAASLMTDPVKLDAENLTVRRQGQFWVPEAGSLRWEADLARLNAWRLVPVNGPDRGYSGQVTGRMNIKGTAASIGGSGEIIAQQLALTERSRGGVAQTLWREPNAACRFTASWSPIMNAIHLDRLELDSNLCSMKAEGNVVTKNGVSTVDLSGDLEYDLQKLVTVFAPGLRQDVQVVGRHKRPFHWTGPLPNASAAAGSPNDWRAAGTGEASLAWDSAKVFGLSIGGGTLDVVQTAGQVTVKPLDIGVGQGQLMLAPRVKLLPEPGMLAMPKGSVIRNVGLNADVCARALVYVNPLLASATRAQGEFSVELSQCSLPTTNPASGIIEGKLTMHRAVVGPGPLVEDIVAAVSQARLLQRLRTDASPGKSLQLTMRDQVIDFRMENGRIYHRNAEAQIGDITVRTHGSVGLDQSLAIVAEIPINQDFVFPIAISGTLKKAKLDFKAMGENFAEQLLERGPGLLDRLLGPRK